MNISTCTNGNRNYRPLGWCGGNWQRSWRSRYTTVPFFASPIIIRLQSGSRQGTAIRTCKLLTCNSSATRMPMYGALTVIIQLSQSISNYFISTELQLLSFVSFLYMIWKHPTISHVNDESAPTRDALSTASTLSLTRPVSPRLADVREPRKRPLPPLWNKMICLEAIRVERQQYSHLEPLLATSLLLPSNRYQVRDVLPLSNRRTGFHLGCSSTRYPAILRNTKVEMTTQGKGHSGEWPSSSILMEDVLGFVHYFGTVATGRSVYEAWNFEP